MGVSSATAARAAYAAAALNLCAAMAMLVGLRNGLPAPGSEATARLTYISYYQGAWISGWLLWHAAAISLLALYVALGSRWQERAPLAARLAPLLAAAGLAADFSAEALYMGLVPRLDASVLPLAEQAMGLLSGYVGNGLYTAAGALLCWAGRAELPARLQLLGLPVWLAGAGLSAACLAASPAGQFWTAAVLMPAFVVWAVLLGRWLARAS